MHVISDGTPGGTHIYNEAGDDISAYFVGAQVMLRADYPNARADLYVAPAVIQSVDMQFRVSDATYRCPSCGQSLPSTVFPLLDEHQYNQNGRHTRDDALSTGDDPL